MADASSPVFYDVSDWSDGSGGDGPGIDRIPKLICEDNQDDDPELIDGKQYSDVQDRWEIGTSDLGRDLVDSDFVFEEGTPIQEGDAGTHDFVISAGSQVDDSGSSSFVFEAGTGIGSGEFQYNARVEDAGDFDYDDCNAHWSETPLDDGNGYISVVIEHRDAGNAHEWWLGETKSAGYSVGLHGGNDSGNQYTVIFEGRMYEDGTVTDNEGNDLGTWK